ncbi:MAG: NosD domain-containing protein [Thermoplasmata archaeon]
MKELSKTTKGVDIRNGRDNTRGFTNGLTNGFANGNGYRNGRKLRESKSHGKVLVVFVLAMLVLSVVAFLTWQSSNAGVIKIDGSFEDWQGVEKTTKERDFGVPENIDIEEYATAEIGKNVAFYAKVYGNLLAGDGRYIVEAPSENPVYVANQRETAIPNANGRDVAYVFIDTDNNPTTGFKPSVNFAVGADKAIEIVGKNGKIEASRVLTFAGVVQQEWNWHICESVAAATNGKQVETMAGKNLLGIGESYAVYFYMIDWQNMECKVGNALRCENARFAVSGLYFNPETRTRVLGTEVETKGTPHDPIHIDGDEDFANQAQINGWDGDGSQGNPYIIEGYDIDANGGGYCIWIQNTNVHFVIRNCNLTNATQSSNIPGGCGIALDSLNNGTVENNKLLGNIFGVYLEFVNNIVIYSNIISSNTFYAIYILSSTNISLSGNIMLASGIMIDCYNLDEWTTLEIEENNMVNNKPVKFYKNCEGMTVSGEAGQVILANCTDCVITGLNITNVCAGISMGYSNNNEITGNCLTSSYMGLYLICSNYNSIRNNTIGNNSDGIYISWSTENNEIMENNVSNNSNGISLGVSKYTKVHDNNISWNNHGIYLFSTTESEITSNRIINNNYGVYCQYSSNNITKNYLEGNYYGIFARDSSYNNITGNTAVGNNYSICIESYWEESGYNNISSNTVWSNYCGIYLLNFWYELYFNRIQYNSIRDNYYGIYIRNSTFNNISYNDVSSNRYGICVKDNSYLNEITFNWICNNTKYGMYFFSGATCNFIWYNNFIGNNGASKGVNGSCQAYDSVGGNYWYDTTTNEGNYWSNWDGQGNGTSNAYPIDGGAGASDWYPLSSPVSEISSIPIPAFFICVIGLVMAVRKRRDI